MQTFRQVASVKRLGKVGGNANDVFVCLQQCCDSMQQGYVRSSCKTCWSKAMLIGHLITKNW